MYNTTVVLKQLRTHTLQTRKQGRIQAMGTAAYIIVLSFLGHWAGSPSTAAEDSMEGPASPCPTDWLFYEGSCYGYFSDRKCWREAEEECQQQGSHLASILTKKECCRLRRYLSRFRPDGDVWIGLHNLAKTPGNASWQWSDGLIADHTQWSTGQPNNYGKTGEWCVELWRSTGFRRWNDELCSRKNSFVCKYEAEMAAAEMDCE